MRSRVDRLYQSGAAVVGALLACLDDAGRLARRKRHRDLPVGGDDDGKKLEPRRSDAQRSSAHPIRAVRNGAAPDLPTLLLYLLSIAAALGHWQQLLMAVPLYLAGTIIRIRDEEKLLRAQFGDEHAQYVRD